jgi:hypothetical protein
MDDTKIALYLMGLESSDPTHTKQSPIQFFIGRQLY